jgi:hypothetical protein
MFVVQFDPAIVDGDVRGERVPAVAIEQVSRVLVLGRCLRHEKVRAHLPHDLAVMIILIY